MKDSYFQNAENRIRYLKNVFLSNDRDISNKNIRRNIVPLEKLFYERNITKFVINYKDAQVVIIKMPTFSKKVDVVCNNNNKFCAIHHRIKIIIKNIHNEQTNDYEYCYFNEVLELKISGNSSTSEIKSKFFPLNF